MGTTTFAQTDFTGGEVSPFVYGRVDLEGYNRSMTVSMNGLALEQGLWVRRPGFQFGHFTKGSGTSASRILTFEASVDASYIIELGNNFYRCFQSPTSNYQWNCIAGSAKAISAVSKTAEAQITTSTAHGMTTGDPVYLYGLSASGSPRLGLMQHLAKLWVREYSATVVNATNFTVPVDTSSNITAFITGSAYAIPMVQGTTSYSSSQVTAIRTVQSVDVMYMVHPDHIPRTLSRLTTAPTFSLQDITFQDGPYLDTNTTATTLTPSDSTGTFTVTASSTTGINSGSGFLSTDVGRVIRLLGDDGNWTWGTIASRSSTTKITVTLGGADLPNLNAITSWRLGLYSGTTGYPKVVVFYGDRLWFGGAAVAPNRVDGSYVGGYSSSSVSFAPTAADGSVTDAHAVAAQLLSRENNQLLWMTADDFGLVMGTAHDVWVVQPAEAGANISATNIDARRVVKRVGSADADVIETPEGFVFIGRSKRKVYLLRERGGTYTAEDTTVGANHLTAGGIEELAFQHDPIPIVWMRRNDGVLVGMTLQGDAVRGYHWHPIGGDTANLYTDVYGNNLAGKVTNLAVVQRADGLADQLWSVTNRNGVYSLEFMREFFDAESADADMFCFDWFQGQYLTGSNSNTGQFILVCSPHLEGKTLDLYIGTTNVGSYTVSSGVISDAPVSLGSSLTTAVLADPAALKMGFSFASKGALMSADAGSSDGGPSIGKRRSVAQSSFYFYRSADVQIGNYDLDQYVQAKIDSANTTSEGTARTLFTGFYHDAIPKKWDYVSTVGWKCTGAFACNIRAVTGFIETQDTG